MTKNLNIVRNSALWWAVKVFCMLVQFTSTWHVFTKQLNTPGRSTIEIYLVSFCALMLIDIFFIAALYFVESDDINTLDKVPFVVVSVLLAVFILVIGYMDEGGIAFAPRVGIIGIVLADLTHFVSEVLEKYFSREAVEQRIRNSQVKTRRREDLKAWKAARQSLAKERVELMIERERKTLGISIEPVLNVKTEEPIEIKPIGENWTEVEPGVYNLGEQFAWSDKQGQLHSVTSLGKSYTQKGARLARIRASKNGHIPERLQQLN